MSSSFSKMTLRFDDRALERAFGRYSSQSGILSARLLIISSSLLGLSESLVRA